MNTVFIGLGSNIGNKIENIKRAIKLIDKECNKTKQSSFYETEPVGFKDQDWFINAAIQVETDLQPTDLFHFLKSVEKEMGRKDSVKNGPRIIDLDILFFNDDILKTETVEIPHPRLHERLFVLEPLTELDKDFMHPVLGKHIYQLKEELELKEEVKKIS